jgi:sugar-specific transcriptional regulator TrmB
MQFGLTPLEAKVYVSLLQTGTASAYRVAKNAKMHRVEAYRALGRLKKLGLVIEFMGRPTLYQPAPPSKGVQLLIDQVARKMKELKEAKQETVRWLKSISTIRQEAEERVQFQLIEGTKSLQETTYRMWSNAKEEVLFTRNQAQIRATAKELATLGNELVIEGIRPRGVADIREGNLQEVADITASVEIRHLSPMNLHMDLIDDSEALFGVIAEQDEETFCIWTNSQSYVIALRELFEHLWEDAFPAALRIRELQSGSFSLYQEYESLRNDLRSVLLDQTTDALKKFLGRGIELQKRLGAKASQ